MARMSLPQIELARTRTSTWPGPGSGTAKVLNSTVLLPGKTAPVMVVGREVMGETHTSSGARRQV